MQMLVSEHNVLASEVRMSKIELENLTFMEQLFRKWVFLLLHVIKMPTYCNASFPDGLMSKIFLVLCDGPFLVRMGKSSRQPKRSKIGSRSLRTKDLMIQHPKVSRSCLFRFILHDSCLRLAQAFARSVSGLSGNIQILASSISNVAFNNFKARRLALLFEVAPISISLDSSCLPSTPCPHFC